MNEERVIHVAYAEDHIAVRKGIISALEGLGGISVDMQADDGAALLDQLLQAQKLPDICMIDINMPKMNGLSLLIEVKKRWPAMRTLILTAYDNEAIIIKMIKSGANGYLMKKCEPSEIKNALEYIFYSGYYYSQVADSDMFTSVNNKKIKLLNLTQREKDFIKYCCTDLSYPDIAAKMNVTTRSVEGFRDRLFLKLKVKTRVGIVTFAMGSGLLMLESSNQINDTE